MTGRPLDPGMNILGITPAGDWLLKDDSASSEEVIESALRAMGAL